MSNCRKMLPPLDWRNKGKRWCYLILDTVSPGRKSCLAGAGAKKEAQSCWKGPCSSPHREKYPGISHQCFSLANLARSHLLQEPGDCGSLHYRETKIAGEKLQEQTRKYLRAQLLEKGSMSCVLGLDNLTSQHLQGQSVRLDEVTPLHLQFGKFIVAWR